MGNRFHCPIGLTTLDLTHSCRVHHHIKFTTTSSSPPCLGLPNTGIGQQLRPGRLDAHTADMIMTTKIGTTLQDEDGRCTNDGRLVSLPSEWLRIRNMGFYSHDSCVHTSLTYAFFVLPDGCTYKFYEFVVSLAHSQCEALRFFSSHVFTSTCSHEFKIFFGLPGFIATICECEGVICHQSKVHTVEISYLLD